MNRVINLEEAYASFDERWSPRIVARVNDYDVKVAHAAGEFVWHDHSDTDEFFLVIAGRLTISLDGSDPGREIVLGPGDIYVVPGGRQHRPAAEEGTRLLLFEPRGTPNTGDDLDGTIGAPLPEW